MNQQGLSGAVRQGRKTQPKIQRTGDVINSQIVSGDNNVVIWGDGNVVVQKITRNQKPKITPFTPPVSVGRPTHAIFLLDRDVEKQKAEESLQVGTPLEFFCPPGFGKSTLLRYFSSQLQLASGMVLIEMRNRMPLEDLFQEIFEAFYECDRIYKPSQVQYRRYFENIQALILLDDVNLTREELQTLRFALPRCVFLIASAEQRLGGEGTDIPLGGLPMKESVALMQKQISRKLTTKELPVVKNICSTLQGNPLRIIEVAGTVRNERKSFEAIAQSLQTTVPEESVHELSLAALPSAQKNVLALLAVLGNAPLPAEHLTEILQTKELAPLLKDLLQNGLVKAHSPRYSLTGSLDVYLNRNWDLSRWREFMLQHFVNWSARGAPRDQILEATGAIFHVMESAGRANRWQEVLQIGQAVEPAFILGKRWGAWAQLLTLLLRASQVLGESAMEAWVLHQIGSRALCLDQFQEAGEYLTRALEIRRAIGDQSGIRATLQNLGQLPGGPPPRTPPRSNGGPSSPRGWVGPMIGGIIGLAVVGAAFLALRDRPGPSIPETGPTDLPIVVSTETPTRTPGSSDTSLDSEPDTNTPSPTFSHTATPSLTATRLPSITPTRTPTKTPTRAPTGTFTYIPNDIPGAPSIVGPVQDDVVYCSGSTVRLIWYEPYDSSGIASYLVTLQYYNADWLTLIDQQNVYDTELDITSEAMSYCGYYFSWTVAAIDNEGAQGDWSPPVTFFVDFPPPTNAPPPAPGVIFPTADQEFSCASTSPFAVQWSAPYDPSGIDHYDVIIYNYNFSNGTWTEHPIATASGTTLDVTSSVRCGTYNAWAVRAIDSEGAVGAWSPSTRFYVQDTGPR